MKNRGTNHAVTARSANFSSYLNHFVITNHLGLTGVQVFMQEWILGLMHKVQPRRIHSTAWPRVGLPSSPYADKHVLLLLAISGIYRDKERKHYSIIITSLNFINFECCGQNEKQSLKRRSHSLYLYVEFSVHDKWDFFFFLWNSSTAFNLTNTKQSVTELSLSTAQSQYLILEHYSGRPHGRISKGFSFPKYWQNTFRQSQVNEQNMDKQSQKTEEKPTVRSHDWLGLFLKAVLDFMYKLAML